MDEEGRLCPYRRGSAGDRCAGRDGHQGDPSVYDPEVGRRFFVRNDGSCYADTERTGLQTGQDHLRCGQAAGSAFSAGIPGSEEDRDRSGGDGSQVFRLRNDERQGRQTF